MMYYLLFLGPLDSEFHLDTLFSLLYIGTQQRKTRKCQVIKQQMPRPFTKTTGK